MNEKQSPRQLIIIYLIIASLLLFGIFFRFFNINHKVYWFDEIYTGFRAAGFTSEEINEEIFQNQFIYPPDLQKFLAIKPGSTIRDTIHSLAVEDPQHPPLYFIMARICLYIFNNSLLSIRILSAVISLFSLPLIYQLGREIFNSKTPGIIAVILLSLSPVDILFAQTARQYSLLSLIIIASSLYLWRGITKNKITWSPWILYTLIGVIGFYTHPFFALTLIAHSLFIVVYWVKTNNKKIILVYLTSLSSILFLSSPWLWIIISNYQRLSDTTSWTKTRVELSYLAKFWLLSFSSLFFDLGSYLWRLPFLLIIIYAVYWLVKKENLTTKLFVLSLAFIPFLLLILPDIIIGGKRSSVTRYLISCFPGIQLIVAYLLSKKRCYSNKFWASIFIMLVIASLSSNTVSAFADTWWSKGISYYNPAIAEVINQSESGIIISDRGNDYTNKGNLISLSYLVKKNQKFLLLSYPPFLEKATIEKLIQSEQIFLYQPSGELLKLFQAQGIEIKPIKSAPGLAIVAS